MTNSRVVDTVRAYSNNRDDDEEEEEEVYGDELASLMRLFDVVVDCFNEEDEDEGVGDLAHAPDANATALERLAQ